METGKPMVNRWIAATGGFFTQVILFIGSTIIPLLLVNIREELGISRAGVGLIISVYGVFYVVGAPVWGAVADRIRLRKALTFASLIVSLGVFAIGAANSLVTYLVVYGIVGFGSAALVVLIPKLLGMWFDIQTKGKASSYITSAGPLSTFILGITVPLLAISHTWRAPFYAFGSFGIILSILIYAIVRDNNQTKESTLSLGSESKPVETVKAGSNRTAKTKDVLKMRSLWHLAAVNLFFLMSNLCVSTFLVAYLAERGLQITEADVGLSVLSAASLAGFYLWGALSDYTQRKYILAICSFLLIAFTFIFLTFQMDLASTFLLVGLMGATTGLAPVFFAIISDYFNFEAVGTATGVIFAILGIGLIVTPLLAGHLANETGSFASVFQLSIVLAGVSSILAILLKRPPRE